MSTTAWYETDNNLYFLCGSNIWNYPSFWFLEAIHMSRFQKLTIILKKIRKILEIIRIVSILWSSRSWRTLPFEMLKCSLHIWASNNTHAICNCLLWNHKFAPQLRARHMAFIYIKNDKNVVVEMRGEQSGQHQLYQTPLS